MWHSIMAGARVAALTRTQHALRDPASAERLTAVTSTNPLIEQLSSVLDALFDTFVTIGPSVRVMAKLYGCEHASISYSRAARKTFPARPPSRCPASPAAVP
jgi:hypothetical protein